MPSFATSWKQLLVLEGGAWYKCIHEAARGGDSLNPMSFGQYYSYSSIRTLSCTHYRVIALHSSCIVGQSGQMNAFPFLVLTPS